jgi:hypothetical protein
MDATALTQNTNDHIIRSDAYARLVGRVNWAFALDMPALFG